MQYELAILGIRGIPAQHGGFETFAEVLALYLVSRGWKVTVYCQDQNVSAGIRRDIWNGVERVTIPVMRDDAIGTIIFDWKSTIACLRDGKRKILTLGYNTAIFCLLYKLFPISNFINMDGIEWRREKWGMSQKAWLWLNERFGCWIGDVLIADHPEIKNHLATRVNENKIEMIPYGADLLEEGEEKLLDQYGLAPGNYALVIARPEPENSVLQIVKAFSRRRRGRQLVVLGRYDGEKNPYHKLVLSSASDEVLFLGAIYEKSTLMALRSYCSLYIHGHQVGGTNPSLVEALGASSAILAHKNAFNAWVAGEGAVFFENEDECDRELTRLLDAPNELIPMRQASKKRFLESFTWKDVLWQYETLLMKR